MSIWDESLGRSAAAERGVHEFVAAQERAKQELLRAAETLDPLSARLDPFVADYVARTGIQEVVTIELASEAYFQSPLPQHFTEYNTRYPYESSSHGIYISVSPRGAWEAGTIFYHDGPRLDPLLSRDNAARMRRIRIEGKDASRFGYTQNPATPGAASKAERDLAYDLEKIGLTSRLMPQIIPYYTDILLQDMQRRGLV